ncbi:MAG: CpaF family protein [Enterococcus sp.]|nr:CpaF family protein [Enterococcus sp.]
MAIPVRPTFAARPANEEPQQDEEDIFMEDDESSFSMKPVEEITVPHTPSPNQAKETLRHDAMVEDLTRFDLEVSPELVSNSTTGKRYENYDPNRRTTPLLIPKKEEEAPEQAYRKMGEITVAQVIDEPYEIYAHLAEKIRETTHYIQELMTEQGKTEQVAKARMSRGSKAYREMSSEIDRLVLRQINRGDGVAPQDVKYFVAAVNNEVLGFGPLEPLWGDSSISEIMVNGPYEIRVERKGRMQIAKGVRFRNAEHLLTVAQQMLALMGRRIDVKSPHADGTLPDGSRINVIHPEIAPNGPLMTIRRFPDTIFSMQKLVDINSLTSEMAETVGNLVYSGVSMVVVGGTGTGKTSMLNALSGCIPENDRVITVEDTLELRLNESKHVVALQARPASAKGEGAVTIRDLVRNTLRMRPDRIIVGEVRDSSAYDMLQAMNTGHEGSLTTVHANDAIGAVERISLLVSEAGEVTADRALSLIAGGVDMFLVIKRYEDGSRRVKGIYEVPSRLDIKDGNISLTPIPLWEFVQEVSEDTAVRGEYQKINDMSESLIRKHALDKRKHLSLEEIFEISKVDEHEPHKVVEA